MFARDRQANNNAAQPAANNASNYNNMNTNAGGYGNPAPPPPTNIPPLSSSAPSMSNTQPRSSSGSSTQGQSSRIETVVSSGCRVNGTLHCDSGIKIEGIVEGIVMTRGNLVIAEGAKVMADVQAYNIVVAGSLKGNITANKIEITETGRVWGDLTVNTLLLSEGSYLRGNTNMMGTDIEPLQLEPPKFDPIFPNIPVLEAPRK
ncbi:MAG: polymer-forming cytoskeletal protein [Anaerolineae bacterium]|nr:polymer-forming cytoskeletal protein [Anaerolineae bacterium]